MAGMEQAGSGPINDIAEAITQALESRHVGKGALKVFISKVNGAVVINQGAVIVGLGSEHRTGGESQHLADKILAKAVRSADRKVISAGAVGCAGNLPR